MAVADSTPPAPPAGDSPFGAVVARQLSVWPFAARTQRLFLLVDPTLHDPDLRHGVVRAMQQAYFRSDGSSQTRAVREAALAAHYVLRHRNRDVLPADYVSAATAVAAVRGDRAHVALAGDAAAFAYRAGALTGQRGVVRLARPLGLEQDPRIELWSSPLGPDDRLVLVCGAVWTTDAVQAVEEILAGDVEPVEAEQRLLDALGGPRPVGALVIDGARPGRAERRLRLLPQTSSNGSAAGDGTTPTSRARRSKWLSPLVALALLASAAAIALSAPPSGTPRAATLQQARVLVEQAGQTPDSYAAHQLVATALDLTRSVAAASPGEYTDIVNQLAAKLDTIDRVAPVTPGMTVRLGPAGGNVVDLAVGNDVLYTLDATEGTVRAFATSGRDQAPTPDTLVLRAGTAGDWAGPLQTPVAMQFVDGGLTVVDQVRTVVRVDGARAARAQPLPRSASWLELGALGTDRGAELFVLDSGARQLLAYDLRGGQPAGEPRSVLDARATPTFPFDHAAEVVGVTDGIVVRLDEGTLRRFDLAGRELPITVRPPDGRPVAVQGLATDRRGGLYLADPTYGRILQTAADGAFVRQLREPALGGVRLIQSSPDGRRLYGLVATGVLAIDVPTDGPSSPILSAGSTGDTDSGH